jgi:superfamily II DNA helicase RecQ
MERVPLFALDEKARGIVYCRMKEDVRRVAEELNCSMYYADSSIEEEKAEVLSGWMRGDSRLMAATTAFTEGINYRYVRVVFYIRAPESAIEFVQGVGRGGRDGRGCLCCVILPKGWTFRIRGRNGELLDEDAMTMEWFLDSPRCRVLSLSLFLDGKAQYCDDLKHACDQCARKGLVGEEEARAEAGVYVRRCAEEHDVGMQVGEELDAGALQLRAYKREQEGRH